jgi:hypothetical protein
MKFVKICLFFLFHFCTLFVKSFKRRNYNATKKVITIEDFAQKKMSVKSFDNGYRGVFADEHIKVSLFFLKKERRDYFKSTF